MNMAKLYLMIAFRLILFSLITPSHFLNHFVALNLSNISGKLKNGLTPLYYMQKKTWYFVYVDIELVGGILDAHLRVENWMVKMAEIVANRHRR